MIISIVQKSARAFDSLVESILPPLAGWRTFPRAFANILVFGLVALFGEWVVHQLAYLIRYGSHFDAVMATTPHRYYMAQAGVLLAVVALLLLALGAMILRLDALKRRRWVASLPARLHRFIPVIGVRIALSAIALTALGLACWQSAVYLIQENLEALAQGGALPGLAVLVAPEHWPVIPLHLVVAFCSSLVLWTISALLNGSHSATAAMQQLVRLFTPVSAVAIRRIPLDQDIADHRLIAGSHSPRSPPLAA